MPSPSRPDLTLSTPERPRQRWLASLVRWGAVAGFLGVALLVAGISGYQHLNRTATRRAIALVPLSCEVLEDGRLNLRLRLTYSSAQLPAPLQWCAAPKIFLCDTLLPFASPASQLAPIGYRDQEGQFYLLEDSSILDGHEWLHSSDSLLTTLLQEEEHGLLSSRGIADGDQVTFRVVLPKPQGVDATMLLQSTWCLQATFAITTAKTDYHELHLRSLREIQSAMFDPWILRRAKQLWRTPLPIDSSMDVPLVTAEFTVGGAEPEILVTRPNSTSDSTSPPLPEKISL